MNIIIVGAGKVGENLCRDLSTEGNDIVLIEIEQSKLEKIMESADITGVVGNGASYEALTEANIKNCDVFIAVTDSDELNIIACIMARKLGVEHTIARVRNPEYSQNLEFVKNELGISLMINPEAETAKTIVNSLKFPCAYSVETFMNDDLDIVELLVEKEGKLDGLMLKDFSLTSRKILVCIVQRGNEIFVPGGYFTLKANDRIYITGSVDAINEFIKNCKYKNQKVQSVFIVGAGRITYYLVQSLLKKNMYVKLVEIDKEKALELSDTFPEIVVVNGDGTDHDFLQDQLITNYDALVSLTGIDEENILLSMYAQNEGLKKTVTKINRNTLKPIVEKLELDTVVTPKMIISDIIVRFVRSHVEVSGSKIENLHRLLNNEVEAMEFCISSDSKAIGIPLKDLNLIADTLIICIKRQNKIIYPGGNDSIQKGDEVLLVTKTKYMDEFEDIIVK